jgi:ubiquinone/menaquinone biosynthesis C-methylase UbiE
VDVTRTGGYDAATAEQYRTAREIPREGLAEWRAAVADEAALAPGMTLLDVGAGTGGFASAFHDWFGVRVLAVEPVPAMRALIPRIPGAVEALDGTAAALPVPDACADAAWLGSVVHHIPDLAAAAAELRRALRPGAPVLIRNAFPGRAAGDIRVRFFPETARDIETTYPTVEEVVSAFATAGFARRALRPLAQHSAADLGTYARTLSRAADSKLRALDDEAFARGTARLRAADPAAPAVSVMDLLVLS